MTQHHAVVETAQPRDSDGLQSRRPTTRRLTPRKFAMLLAATALVGVPAVAVATSATAATTFSVVTPAEGSTVSYVAPTFSGTGATPGDTVSLSYVGISNPTASATKFVGDPVVGPDGTWSTPTNFEELAPDTTQIVVTATELGPDGTAVSAPIVRTFNTDRATNLSFPFLVSSPTTLEVITTSKPTATGSATPGDVITVSYGNLDASVTVAGTATTGTDGAWSAPLDLSGVVLNGDGTLNNLGLIVSRVSADGSTPVEASQTVTVQYQPGDEPTPTPTPTPTDTPTTPPTEQPTPGPTTEPTDDPTAAPPIPAPTTTASPAPTPSNPGTPGNPGGDLPSTGVSAAPLLGGATLLIAAGLGFVAFRRFKATRAQN